MHDFFLYQLEGYELFHFGTESSLFQRRYEGSGSYVQSYAEKMRDETEHETSVKHALVMLADGVPCEKVAKYTDLSIEEVRALAEKKSA